jgi:ABC-type branched-subunit amino acid transport system ATPase component
MGDLLALDKLRAGYGEAVVLSGLSLCIAEGQALAVLGRNGMGKTTLVNSIVGVTRYFGGTIRLDGVDITSLRPDRRAAAGIGWVPQERNIFKSLTVDENLTAIARPGPWTRLRIFELFPAPGRAPSQLRQSIIGRRAADAGGGARACPQPAHSAARRAARRAGSDSGRGIGPRLASHPS